MSIDVTGRPQESKNPTVNASRALRWGDPSSAPRLALGHSHWSLTGLSTSVMSLLPQLAEGGCELLEVNLTSDLLSTAREAKKLGFVILGQGLCVTAEETKPIIAAASELGVVGLNLHLGHSFMEPTESVDLVGETRTLADAAGITLLVETHRGRITQDLLRTSQLITLDPSLRFTLDLSHYWVGNEGEGNNSEKFRILLQQVLERTLVIHGRISDGESVQIDIGERAENVAVSAFRDNWSRAMSAWLTRAQRGDVFVFEPELGPWPYAQIGRDGREFSDRWRQSLLMADIGREAWSAAVAGLR